MAAEHINGELDRFLKRWRFVASRNIDHFAERSAEWLRLQPPPRYAEDVLAGMGIRVTRESLPAGLDAVWSVENGVYLIRVSPFVGTRRANFTLWHEWFEVMASRPAFPHRLAPSARERLADRYAAALTMPAREVACSLQEFACSGDKADVMAERFGISVAAMRRRIRELAPAHRRRAGAGDDPNAWTTDTGNPRDGCPDSEIPWPR